MRNSKPNSSRTGRPARSGSSKSERPERGARPERSSSSRSERPERPSSARPDRPTRGGSSRPDRPARSGSARPERTERPERSSYSDRPARGEGRSEGGRGNASSRPTGGGRSNRQGGRNESRFNAERPEPKAAARPERPAKAPKDTSRHDRGKNVLGSRPKRTEAPKKFVRDEDAPKPYRSNARERIKEEKKKEKSGGLHKEFVPEKAYISKTEREGLIRLNKFLSNAGVASRREADQLIELGLVHVNGVVVKELGLKIDPKNDVVKYDDAVLRPEKLRYFLLNKPKGFLTTMEDPEGRRTVMDLVKDACVERIYPVGRLDRATTGLLLFTNDGELAKRLMHPKHEFPKLYHVETDQKVRSEHIDQMREGFVLDDGFIKADEIEYVEGVNAKKQVGIRIHSGRNRIVRRMFEHFGYTVVKLDRVMYAGLTKKELTRGRYRPLTEGEIGFLKMIR
ncbi:MAG: pseudouridine synthase [Flavobacteriales bacterium]